MAARWSKVKAVGWSSDREHRVGLAIVKARSSSISSAAPPGDSAKTKAAKPLTYKQALSAEEEILRNPMTRRMLDNGGSIGDGKFLEVIDRTQRAGKAGKLPEAVAERLEVWRK